MAVRFTDLSLTAAEVAARELLIRRIENFLRADFNPNSNIPAVYPLKQSNGAAAETVNRRVVSAVIVQLEQAGWSVQIARSANDGFSTLEFSKVSDLSRVLEAREVEMADRLEKKIDQHLRDSFWRDNGLRCEYELPKRPVPRIVLAEIERRFCAAGWWVDLRGDIAGAGPRVLVFKHFGAEQADQNGGKTR